MSSARVAIVGGGVAGLTAALCLARKGIASDVIEQAPRLSTVGAGLQLSPNATAILGALGLLAALEDAWSEPEAISLISGTSLRPLAHVPSGPFARTRWKAPYGVLHRASLQRILVAAVEAEPLCRLHLGHRLEADMETVIARVTGGVPDLIIGADGIRSAVRARIPQAGVARFSGMNAWRFMIAQEDAPAAFDPRKVTAFLGADAHIVVYPLRKSGTYNVVAITKAASAGTASAQSPAGDADRNRLIAAVSDWNVDLVRMLDHARAATFWPLHMVADGAWHDGGKAVLIGDAAHAMMPFAAQGAAMAIEDAFELAAFLGDAHSLEEAPSRTEAPYATGAVTKAREAALAAFVAHRKPRIARVKARAAFNRFVYHAGGPVRMARDLVLSHRRPESLAADFDWLYGYAPRD